tara:strand:- start:1565 stop:1867 length:303 start_codon:yes stop_codon:yes gene_type:complete
MNTTITIVVSFLIILICLLAAGAAFILRRLLYFSENVEQLLISIDVFSKHLEEVHSMETFYGEPVLQNLLDHSKEVRNDVQEFVNVYSGGEDSPTPPKEG